ncbi:hypothetical protein BURCENBC7_AP0492 [Burkholderia cenocepacia BC7]|nr:hypothetical protein BURCENBC7_AP0492 [Burkholderia cenocepacia BC7]
MRNVLRIPRPFFFSIRKDSVARRSSLRAAAPRRNRVLHI